MTINFDNKEDIKKWIVYLNLHRTILVDILRQVKKAKYFWHGIR